MPAIRLPVRFYDVLLNVDSQTHAHPRNVYLGYLPLLLVLIALARNRKRRFVIFWFILALSFTLLRLGTHLVVDGVRFEHIRLPKHYLAGWFPHLFEPFWSNDNFHAGALFPFAALCCYGLRGALPRMPARRRHFVIVILASVVAFEYYQPPTPSSLPEQELAFINWLKSEDDQGSIRLVNLPMGGQVSKIYDFHQSMHGYPHVEGRPTRTPPVAFKYIESNELLNSWRHETVAHCLMGSRETYLESLNQLSADGFSHFTVRKSGTIAVAGEGKFCRLAQRVRRRLYHHISCDRSGKDLRIRRDAYGKCAALPA